MIPATLGSELQKKFQDKAKQAGLNIKIVEKAGQNSEITLKDLTTPKTKKIAETKIV